MDSLLVLFWATIGGVVSLLGGILLLTAVKARTQLIKLALPFGAGALIAAAFLELLPEAVEESDIHIVASFALVGFLAFFILERLLGWFHHHHHDEVHGNKNKVHASLVVIGDTLHNAIDGVAIGAAFLISPAVGIATSLAVAFHEIPTEIGDFGILLGKGMRRRNVIIVNLASSLATVVAAMAVYWLGSGEHINPAPLLALAVGFFIYISASDIIPDIHERPRHEGNVQAVMLVVGAAVIALLTLLIPDAH